VNRLMKLKAELMKRIRLPGERPFVCEGSPLDCDIFIVGLNPATPMVERFDTFWRGEHFAKEKWLACYERAREMRGKKKSSRTRKRLDAIRERFPSRCLETNLYWIATESEREFKRLRRKHGLNTDNFYFLLTEIRPRVVVGHGRHVKKAGELIRGMDIRFIPADNHLSRISDESFKM